MVLPGRQRRILKKIEHAMQGSDPRLTSLFATFSLLSRDEEMPKVEQLRARASLLLASLQRELATAGRRLRPRPLAQRRAALFYPLAVMALASTLVMAAALPGASQCAAAAAGTARHSTNVKTCQSAVISPVFHAR